MRLLIAMLLLSGCQTVKTIERFDLKSDAPPERVIEAAEQAAKALGEDVFAGRGNVIELRGVYLANGQRLEHVLVESPEPGTLHVTSEGMFGSGITGALVASGTDQVLKPQVPAVSRVAPRSKPIAGLLDAVFPFAGGLYVSIGDPHGMQWPMRIGALLSDLAAVGLIIESQLVHPLGPTISTAALIGGILSLVLNRVIALQFDLPAVTRRNAAASSGFDFDQLPQPADVQLSRSPTPD